MKTKYACKNAPPPPPPGGGKKKISGGSVFLIIFFVGGAVYLAAGMLYKRQRMGVEGVEMVPNIDFWREVPGNIKDGVKFSISKVRGGGDNRDYASI